MLAAIFPQVASGMAIKWSDRHPPVIPAKTGNLSSKTGHICPLDEDPGESGFPILFSTKLFAGNGCVSHVQAKERK